MVHWFLGSEDIFFCDEDDPDFREVLIFCALVDFPGVYQCMVETGTLGICTLVGSLNFYIVDFAVAVNGENIKTYAAAIEIMGRTLGNNF